MELTSEIKQWIDSQDYLALLRRWRFGPIGDPIFQGESFEYYKKTMAQKKQETRDNGVSASKTIGW